MENKARARFFASMEGDMQGDSERNNDALDIDFSFTESGRTVAHMVDSRQGVIDDMDFSLTSSGRMVEQMGLITEQPDRDGPKTQQGGHRSGQKQRISTSATARSIPVPQPPQSSLLQPTQSQASSQASSGSAFLSSVLNPTASTFGNTQLSHTPPVASSYEVSHFGKRARSGSISGRLRSASEYLEDKGLLDRQTKGILKDLIIIGDEEIQQALDRYEAGDPSVLEDMIRSGALQNRLPSDIDILGDLDLDFLNVTDEDYGAMGDTIEPLRHVASDQGPMVTRSNSVAGRTLPPNTVSPAYDDGIGELDFAGDFVSDQTDYMQMQQPQTYGDSKQPSVAASPQDQQQLSEYEQRMRSNSLFSALLNDPRGSSNNSGSGIEHGRQYGQWMGHASASGGHSQGIQIAARRSSHPGNRSGISASLEAEKKKREKQEKKEQKAREKQEKKGRKEQEKKKAAVEDIKEEHVPGSGRPRSLSDPNLRASLDEHGLRRVERPDGWIGAYSPESRKVRIGKFLAKRNHRVWTKTVKYDVRKNFADSRLRVKGRFVKKEDELLMRELMSLT